jgi:DNA-binding transcriptional MerR regulator
MSKDAPKAPDYEAAAEEQGRSSREVTEQQTWANRPNQNTPWGSTTWSSQPYRDPTTGQMLNRWTQNVNLDPRLQQILDTQFGVQGARSELAGSMTGRMADEYGEAMNWEDFARMGGRVGPEKLTRNIGTHDRYVQDAEDAIYGKFTNKMDSRFQDDLARQDAQLRAQGLKPGDAAYEKALERAREEQNQAYEQAAYQATIGSGAEAQRYQGMDATAGQFRNAASQQAFNQQMESSKYDTLRRQQQIAEEMQKRGFSLNEINAILHGQQVGMPQMPDFSNATKSDATNYLGAAQAQGQADLDRYNAEQQAMQGMMSGVGSMGAGAMMMSDRALKRDIRKIVERGAHGLPVYEFRYVDEDGLQYGVMADEAELAYPDAVVTTPSGYKAVDYARLQSV